MLRYKLYQIIREFQDGREDPANNKWFGRAVQLGTVSTDDLAQKVSYSTTLTKADVKGVIEALVTEMQSAMKLSQTVVLDGIGSFKLGIKTTGASKPEDFSVSNNVTQVHVVYTPSYKRNSGSGKKVCSWTDDVKIGELPKNAVGVE